MEPAELNLWNMTKKEGALLKIYISADLEGAAGVVSRDQLGGENENYRRARQLMTGEVNAAARGAFEAGAKEVVVNDSHGAMTNILIEDLDQEIKLISGSPKEWSMMAGISERFDLVFLLGYHARQGERGTLSHTYSSSALREMKLNNQVVGELGLSAYIAGYFGVAVGLVTGDDEACSEAKSLLGNHLKTAEVKKNLGHRAVESLTPAKAGQLIREQACQAVREKESMQPVTLESPVVLELAFQNRGMAEEAASMPGANMVSGSTVQFSHPDFREVAAAMQVMVTLARS